MADMDQLNRFLGKDENVLAAYPSGKMIFCATEKRVLSYQKGWKGEKFSDVAYNHITTVNLESRIRKGLVYLGVVFIFIGLITLLASGTAGAVLFVLGLLFIILGIVLKVSMYSIHTSGAENFAFSSKQKDADNFVRIIRERMK